MMRAVLVLVVALAATLAGCVNTSATRLGKTVIRPAVRPETVIIYRTADQVPGRYDEVALVNVEGDHTFAREERLYAKMREAAATMGANALILDGIIEPAQEERMSGKWWLELSHALYTNVINPPNRKGKAIAIYVHSN